MASSDHLLWSSQAVLTLAIHLMMTTSTTSACNSYNHTPRSSRRSMSHHRLRPESPLSQAVRDSCQFKASQRLTFVCHCKNLWGCRLGWKTILTPSDDILSKAWQNKVMLLLMKQMEQTRQLTVALVELGWAGSWCCGVVVLWGGWPGSTSSWAGG